jgi:hypothetical protein
MQPHYIASQMSKAPLDNIDGAARVLDPVRLLRIKLFWSNLVTFLI